MAETEAKDREPSLPRVSVIIPVKNGERHLPRCLESLGQQDYPAELVEVLVADGRSTDRSREIAHSWGATVLDNPREKQVAGRNLAFAASRGERIALCDDDCVMDPEWLRNSLKYFADPAVGGIGGPTLLPEDEGSFGRAVAVLFQLGVWIAGSVQREDVDRVREVDDIPGGNAIYRREALARVMPIDEDFLSGEDVELNFQLRRAGFRILAVPDVVVWHYKRQSPRELWRQMYRFAVGRVKNGRRDRSMIRPGHVLAGLSLPLLLAAAAAAAALGPWALGALAAAAALGAVSLVAGGWWMSGSLAVAGQVPLVLGVGAAAWSAGFLREVVWPYRNVAMR